MTALVIRGDARNLPLPDASVDLIVTSPPYFGLRSYTDGGQHYAGQIGDEASPREYVDNLLACTREWMRVLKPEGNLWLNLGDKYSTGNSGQSGLAELGAQWAGGGHSDQKAKRRSNAVRGMQPKSLIGLPWRYAIGCIDELGLILRAEVIWSKPNGLPESVTDRVRRSHEQWFHLVKQPRYFSAVDEIREPHAYPNDISRPRAGKVHLDRARHMQGGGGNAGNSSGGNPLGKLPGSVWEVSTRPLKVPDELEVDHFAAFPTEWPRRLILGWSPDGICIACGEGRQPVSERALTVDRGGRKANVRGSDREGCAVYEDSTTLGRERVIRIVGYTCACPDSSAPTRPAVVLDPFGGTGTTALVASVLGRRGVTVDRSADYCRIAQWRTTDPGERARVLGLPRPQPVPEGQPSLFDELGEAS
ncbi:site-specific DNA-methyltransferase [Microbispora sp. KK1-11]|uniref:DNA-methyltransferase n=1 Tax=Microbispora sp. KK1-11 TaxID=2053005 RepID=UPI00163C62BF|nr:site-specific DNA-methyltransferase [Microbispora sp. KK1-11]